MDVVGRLDDWKIGSHGHHAELRYHIKSWVSNLQSRRRKARVLGGVALRPVGHRRVVDVFCSFCVSSGGQHMIQLRFAGAPRVILARKRLPRLEGVDALGWGERAVYRIQTVLKRERERVPLYNRGDDVCLGRDGIVAGLQLKP